MYGFDHGGWMFGGGMLMLLWWLVVIGAVVAIAVYWLKPSARGPAEKSALNILKERYARGEIQKEEFEQKKRDLDS